MENRLLLLFFLLQNSCATISQNTSNSDFFKNDKVMKVSLGQSIELLKKSLGNPSSISAETFPPKKYQVWEYASANRGSQVFFTLDSASNRVVGRTIEFFGSDAYDLEKLLKGHFNQNKFDQRYSPCHSRGLEEVLVDASNGVFIATRDGKVLMVSWVTPQLAQLRIDDFYLKCPRLQPERQ